jgi:hypothetical protein
MRPGSLKCHCRPFMIPDVSAGLLRLPRMGKKAGHPAAVANRMAGSAHRSDGYSKCLRTKEAKPLLRTKSDCFLAPS